MINRHIKTTGKMHICDLNPGDIFVLNDSLWMMTNKKEAIPPFFKSIGDWMYVILCLNSGVIRTTFGREKVQHAIEGTITFNDVLGENIQEEWEL